MVSVSLPETVLKNNRHKELKMEAVQIILDEKQLAGYLFCYKERWEIENCVGYMKNCVVKKPQYSHTNDNIDAQYFINHVALLYFHRLIRAMDDTGMKGKYSPDEIIRRGNNIYKISVYTGHKQLAEMKKNTELFRRLCIVIL